jgi:hypothetical protein
MSLTAEIHTDNRQPWLYITAPNPITGAMATIIYDGPIDLTTKAKIKAEIDWAHEKTGMARPDLYDAVRAYQAQQRRVA